MKWFEKLSGRWIANLMNTSLTRTRRTRSSKPTHLHFSWVSSRLILADTLSRRMNESCLFVDCKVIPGNSCVPEAQTVSVSDEFVVGAMVFNCLARPKTILTAIFVFQNFVWTAGMYFEKNKSFSWDLDLCPRTLIVPVRPEELFWVLFNWFLLQALFIETLIDARKINTSDSNEETILHLLVNRSSKQRDSGKQTTFILCLRGLLSRREFKCQGCLLHSFIFYQVYVTTLPGEWKWQNEAKRVSCGVVLPEEVGEGSYKTVI